jgi:CheY-like chemotaxis protein
MPKRALVVNDEALVALFIENVLRDQCYEVTVATSRNKLRETVLMGWYDLVIADADFATTEDMHQLAADRIVLCTAEAPADGGPRHRCTSYLSKPFTEGDLLRALGREQ